MDFDTHGNSISDPSYGSSQNVGFNPGIVNGYDPIYTKGRYQQMLTEQMYGDENFKQWIDRPWPTFWWKQVIFLGFCGVFFAIVMQLVLADFIESFSTYEADPALRTQSSAMSPVAMFLVILVVLGFTAYFVNSRTIQPYIRTKNFVAWKATPEGAYWVQLQLHPEPWDPQFPGYPDKDQPLYKRETQTYYQEPAQPKKRAQSDFIPNKPFGS